MKKKLLSAVFLGVFLCSLASAKSEKTSKSKKNEATAAATESSLGLKRKVAIYRFTNESKYAKGAFYDSAKDPVNQQAVKSLTAKLTQTGKFIVLERLDTASLNQEVSKYYNADERDEVNRISADYVIIGAVTSYGRKETGKKGIATKKKTQTVEVGLSLSLIDARTGQVVYGEQAEGSAETETKTTFGLGGQAGYDETLTDKALDAALSQMVENITNKCMDDPWKSSLNYDSVNDEYYMDGGKGMNINEGDVFAVMRKGSRIKNSHTGKIMELPGKQVGTVTVLWAQDDGLPEDQMSIVSVSGDVPKALKSYDDYTIQEIRK